MLAYGEPQIGSLIRPHYAPEGTLEEAPGPVTYRGLARSRHTGGVSLKNHTGGVSLKKLTKSWYRKARKVRIVHDSSVPQRVEHIVHVYLGLFNQEAQARHVDRFGLRCDGKQQIAFARATLGPHWLVI